MDLYRDIKTSHEKYLTAFSFFPSGAISSGFRLEDSPFVPYDFLNSSNSPASPPGSIGDGWPRAKSPNGSSSVNWPPGTALPSSWAAPGLGGTGGALSTWKWRMAALLYRDKCVCQRNQMNTVMAKLN